MSDIRRIFILLFAATLASVVWPNAFASVAQTTTIHVREAKVHGHKERILTNERGMTLYYFTKDTPTKIACTGGCAKAWPPALIASGTPTGPREIQSGLSVLKDSLGRQIEYRGHPLYTFVKDKHPGEVSGQGVLGHWFVATPNLKNAGSGN